MQSIHDVPDRFVEQVSQSQTSPYLCLVVSYRKRGSPVRCVERNRFLSGLTAFVAPSLNLWASPNRR